LFDYFIFGHRKENASVATQWQFLDDEVFFIWGDDVPVTFWCIACHQSKAGDSNREDELGDFFEVNRHLCFNEGYLG